MKLFRNMMKEIYKDKIKTILVGECSDELLNDFSKNELGEIKAFLFNSTPIYVEVDHTNNDIDYYGGMDI